MRESCPRRMSRIPDAGGSGRTPGAMPAAGMNASGREYTKPGIWLGQISSITLKCSTTGPGVTVISVASVRRPLNRPRREDRICLRAWGQSKTFLFLVQLIFCKLFYKGMSL